MMHTQDFPLISHSPRRWAEFVRMRTPILESIVPLDSRGRMNWMMLGNDSLLAHARWKIADGGIGGRKELKKADSGLYQALKKRKLLDEIGLPDSRGERRDWAGMEREELVAYSKEFIAENRIGGRNELKKADSGLYQALKKRKLLDEVGLAEKQRDWAGMGNEEMVAFSKKFIAEKKIGKRAELEKADSGLYNALRRWKLLDAVALEEKRKTNDWSCLDDGELVAFARDFNAVNGITTRAELVKADTGLLNVLWRRELLGEAGLPDKNRDWAGMGKGELVAYAKEFISERGIGGRKELEKADRGLYDAMRRRKLLDAVFSDAESSKHADAVKGVLDALESFGDSE